MTTVFHEIKIQRCLLENNNNICTIYIYFFLIHSCLGRFTNKIGPVIVLDKSFFQICIQFFHTFHSFIFRQFSIHISIRYLTTKFTQISNTLNIFNANKSRTGTKNNKIINLVKATNNTTIVQYKNWAIKNAIDISFVIFPLILLIFETNVYRSKVEF
jgi:hypothetical protein